jgi:hypothetical protein
MSHYEQTEMKGRMSRDFAKAWKKGFEECILEFIKTAGSNALNARVTKFDKMKVNYLARERLIYLLNDENRSFLFNLIENLLFFLWATTRTRCTLVSRCCRFNRQHPNWVSKSSTP